MVVGSPSQRQRQTGIVVRPIFKTMSDVININSLRAFAEAHNAAGIDGFSQGCRVAVQITAGILGDIGDAVWDWIVTGNFFGTKSIPGAPS